MTCNLLVFAERQQGGQQCDVEYFRSSLPSVPFLTCKRQLVRRFRGTNGRRWFRCTEVLAAAIPAPLYQVFPLYYAAFCPGNSFAPINNADWDSLTRINLWYTECDTDRVFNGGSAHCLRRNEICLKRTRI